MKTIIIDDQPQRFDRWKFALAQDAEFYNTLQHGLTRLVQLWVRQERFGIEEFELFLDHDLGGDQTTMPIAQFLELIARIGQPLKISHITVHSQNPVGAQNLRNLLQEYYDVD